MSMGTRLKRSNHYFIKNHIMNHLPEAQHFYDRHGGRAIILGRFFPVIRTYIPFLAGIVRMEKGLFLKNTILGAVVWIVLFLMLGFFVGEIAWVKNNYGLIFIALVIITLIPLMAALIRRKRTISK
jgi:membrane-associated protein